MFIDVNKVILTGIMYDDPKLTIEDGIYAITFTISVFREYNNKADFHIVRDEQSSPSLINYIKKGSKIYVEGELRSSDEAITILIRNGGRGMVHSLERKFTQCIDKSGDLDDF